jgi:hypothetical protein
LHQSAITFTINGNALDVFVKEIRPDRTKHGNTIPNGSLFTLERCLMDLHRIVITEIPEILFVSITGQVEVGLICCDPITQNHFTIIHKVQELSSKIHTRSYVLFFHFVCEVDFVR